MRKQKKILVQLLIFLSLILSSCTVFASSITDYLEEIQLSEAYLEYLEQSQDDIENMIAPRMYEIPKTKMTVTNPLKWARLLGSSISSSYSLRTVIPENMVIKDQGSTNTCWTFSSLAVLESTLALKDYKNGNSTVIYDFSERHMDYATSRVFLNNEVNEYGFNRDAGSGGVSTMPIAYLTNGSGAIDESEMEFKNNSELIDISEIQNKEVVTQVNDVVIFPSYSEDDDKTTIIEQMKQHIMNYGAINAGIHGASLSSSAYNNSTGAIYCSDSSTYPPNHAVAIIGWNDNYSIENFVEGNRPQNNGAWIIKNSWGTELERYTLAEMKEIIFENFYDECIEAGWTDETQIPDDIAILNFSNWGYTIENNEAVYKVGDDGFMYISYEDANVYLELNGIIDAQTEITYENLYQYDIYGGVLALTVATPKIYLATEFDKQTTVNEYLTQISVHASETYTCKVYVNPNGTSKAVSDLQQVQLKAGETETFDAGYHTIEFLEPLKINSDSFVVVLEIEGTQTNSISCMIEMNFGEFFTSSLYANAANHVFDNVTVESAKCFLTTEEGMTSNQWDDASMMYSLTGGKIPNFDTTIKAFTTSNVLESIEVTTPPTKTTYVEGQNFDSTGMVVKALYGNGTSIEITDYTLANNQNLELGQTSVTILYEGKTTIQNIEVVENVVESIAIISEPTKKEYWAGDDFDATGMVVQATYTDGTTQTVTEYTIVDGTTLENGQTTVTIEYERLTVTQSITVKENGVVEIEITQIPNKVTYVAGQNFNKDGMKVEATYENGMVKEVEDYIVQDGINLQEGQTTVTIEYEGLTVTLAITVEVKTITSITVKTMPAKAEYIQNKEELDLTGGEIEILYNDGASEIIAMTSDEITATGYDNKKLGIQTITLTYKGEIAQFDVVVVEEEKPENSNFDNIQGNLTRIRAYYFTDTNISEYAVLNIELNDIIKATENDSMEYYYYLSPNQEEYNIKNWVKINSIESSDDKLSFEINTSDISNYAEVSDSDVLYLYIKEVATRNEMTAEVISSSVLLEVNNVNLEEYVDGAKKTEIEPGSTSGDGIDNTLAPGIIPNAGKSLLIICLILAVAIIGRVTYLRYKDIEIK